MANSYIADYVHAVFSTKNRLPLISDELRDRLWAYMGGMFRQNGMQAVAVDGMPDHVHLLISLPAVVSVAKAVQLVKGGSSKWVHDTFPACREFGWQEGYGAFSTSVSRLDDTIAYIHNQVAHHHQRPFQQEYIALLRKHGVEFDERFLWG